MFSARPSQITLLPQQLPKPGDWRWSGADCLNQSGPVFLSAQRVLSFGPAKRRFGYLQLDTVSIAGARSHAIVLLSRLEGFDHELAEALLRPREPLFEYWG